jgi:hypothetical protein
VEAVLGSVAGRRPVLVNRLRDGERPMISGRTTRVVDALPCL